jgi:hypothetical protein
MMASGAGYSLNAVFAVLRANWQRLAGFQGVRGGFRHGHRRADDIGVDDLIEQRRLREQAGRQRLAGEHDVDGPFDADEPRQTLRAAGTRQQTELDLRQSHFRGRGGDAVMAAHREFQSPAERDSLDGRDHRLRHVVQKRGQRRQ